MGLVYEMYLGMQRYEDREPGPLRWEMLMTINMEKKYRILGFTRSVVVSRTE